MTLKASPHFWPGNLSTAFVFSVPGRHEKDGHRPVAGPTGANLSAALAILHSKRPDRFRSSDKDDYRITNAYYKPIWSKESHGRSEATVGELEGPGNRKRLVRELKDCNLIVWCGKNAQYMQRLVADQLPDKIHIAVPHLSPRALWSLKVPTGSSSLVGLTVHEIRIESWAMRVLDQSDPMPL